MLRTISWVVLMLLTVLVLLGSLASLNLAYLGEAQDDIVTGEVTIADITDQQDVALALRGRRGTAAAFSAAFATLMLFVILSPYRRGQVWAWWAILVSVAVLAAGILLRVPLLHSNLGAQTGTILLVAYLVGLLLDVGRLKTRAYS